MKSKNKNYITKIAKTTIEIEAKVIKTLKLSINGDFCEAVVRVQSITGRVVITGIGKSAIVAQKIVATLNSTGTPSLFMHAADAIHGDLGMIQRNDAVMCISKSGDTPEIKVLLPLLKSRGNLLIGMVSNLESYLAKQADFILHTPISREADPNNLAPTASTTAQMVMGDAFATALLALRGFSPEDFAYMHPGGALGKQLYLRVSDIYILHERPVVFEEDDIQKIIMEMTSKRLGATAVVNENHELVGIITDGDLRRMLEKTTDIASLKAKNIMGIHPKTIEKDTLAVHALQAMRQKSITQLVVVDKNAYLGMVHLHDLLKEGLGDLGIG
jgi:arabinose-5-phosphate isomerase